MVLDDVAQNAGRVIEPASLLDPDRLGRDNLNVVDVFSIPEGLENRICKTKDQDVLHRLLAQVMVNPICLAFIEVLADGAIQSLCGCEIPPEGFFDDHSTEGLLDR